MITGMIKGMHKGARIVIANGGMVYPANSRMAERLGAVGWHAWAERNCVDGDKGVLLNWAPDNDGEVLCLVRVDGQDYVIHPEGFRIMEGEFTKRNLIKI